MSLLKLIELNISENELKKYLEINSLEIFNEDIIFSAIDHDNTFIIDRIVEKEVDLSKYEKNKKNPFIYSVSKKKYDLAKNISKVIDINLFDEYNQSFLYFLIDHDFKKSKKLLDAMENITEENLNKKNLYNGNTILMECALSENIFLFRYLLSLSNSITYDFEARNFENQNLKELIYESEVSEMISEYNRHFFTNNLKT